MKKNFIQQMFESMSAGEFDHTDHGKCTGCGECCADILPISEQDISTIRKYIEEHGIRMQGVSPAIKPETKFKCPFRNDSEKKCVIYEVRPAICRDFKCDNMAHGIAANPDMYKGRMHVISMRSVFFEKR